jgi:hypothetical protein
MALATINLEVLMIGQYVWLKDALRGLFHPGGS